MKTIELVSELRKRNITLQADNGQLVLSGPKGVLPPEMRAELLDRKEEILNCLNYVARSSVSNTPSVQPVFRDRTLPLSFAQQHNLK